MPQFFDAPKSVETIVYIAQKTHDLFHVVKTLYYADKFHLKNYGRLITGDHYVAMDEGPVPSGAYDLIKEVRGDGVVKSGARPEQAFKVEKHINVIPRRKPNLDYLSESDIEALDKAIGIYARMDFGRLWRIAHNERPYQDAAHNASISLVSIIKSLPNADEVLEYLSS
jgi:uncharacterized phage-associated protein